MKQVLCTALASTLLLVAAPTQAQQFSFVTGDRAMQGYTPPATNDGYQAGGGGNPGQAPDLSNSPYQSGSIANTGPGAQASATQGAGGNGSAGGTSGSLFTGGGNSGGGGAGGTGAILRTVGDGGGTNSARIDLNRPLDGSPSLGDGKPSPLVVTGLAGGDQKGGQRTNDPTNGGAGGNNTAIMGSLPKGLVGTNPAGSIPCPQCNLSHVAGSGATLVNADAAAAAAAGRGNILGTGTTPSATLVNPSAPYTFKFNAPQTQAFANLGPSIGAATAAKSVVTPAPVALQNLNTVAPSTAAGLAAAGGVRTMPVGSVTGVNSGLGATQLKSLQSVGSVNGLLARQKP